MDKLIVKRREKSIYISQLEALGSRIKDFHRKREEIEDDNIKAKTGAKGENEITFPLTFLSTEDYFILHNLRIPDSNSHFEIDTLILSGNFFLLVEVKNWYGTLYFDGERQVIRIGDGGKEEGLPNPIPQVKLQRHRLQKVLNQQNFPRIPLLYFIVFSFPSTIIKPMFPEFPVPKEVFHCNLLFQKISELNRQYETPVVDIDTLKKISSSLVTAHKPKEKNVLDNYGIKQSELIKGVKCPKCSEAPMARRYGKWHCRRCNHFSKDAHIATLNDYILLIGNEITNREAREFLMVDSPNVVKNILQKEGYRASGSTKSRTYHLILK